MSWFKEILSSLTGGSEAPQAEAENVAAPSDDTDLEKIRAKRQENSQRMEEVREKRDEKEKAADDLKLVIDTAKLECKLCTNPQGLLKVNFDTPTIQSKKTATVMEKDMKSLIFTGSCKKSSNSSSPCASVMQLGEWKDTGSLKVQDQSPLLLKSTITCQYGGINIKITDCGQVSEPASLNVTGAPVPASDIVVLNGHYYNTDGTFEGKIDKEEYSGSVEDVYTCTGKEKKADPKGKAIDVFKELKLMKENGANISHPNFSYIAYVVKSEAGKADLKELKCIAYASYNKAQDGTLNSGEKSKWKKLLATAYSSVENKKSLDANLADEKSKLARVAVFYVLNGENDLTNGATFWDGTDFLAWGNSETNPYKKLGSNKFDEYNFIEIPKAVYDDYLAANGSSARYGDKGNHVAATDKGEHEHIKKTIKKKLLGKDGKVVLDDKGKPMFEEVEVPDKIKYPIPAEDFKDQDYWKTGDFYYETGAKQSYGISATINAGKSIFWKRTKTRLLSDAVIKK